MCNLKDKLNSLKNKKEESFLFKNTVMLYILQFSGYFFSFITVPYQTRIMGPEIYGKLGVATAMMVYFQLFLDFGFMLSATEDVTKNHKDKKKLSAIFTSVTLIKVVFAIVSIAVLGVLSLVSEGLKSDVKLYAIFLAGTIVNSFMPDYLYRGMQKMTTITVRAVLVKMFFTVMIFILLSEPSQYIRVPMLTFAGNSFALIGVYIHLYGKMGIRFCKVKFADILASYRKSSGFFLSRIASAIYSSSNAIILQSVDPTGSDLLAGLYTSANKLVVTAQSAMSPIADSVYPYMIKNKNFKMIKKTLLLMMPPILLGSAGVFIFADQICTLIFGPEFTQAGSILRALMPIVVVTLPNYILGFPTLGAMGLMKQANNSIVFATFFHIIGLILLFRAGKINAVSLAYLTSFTESFILAYRLAVIFIYSAFFETMRLRLTSKIKDIFFKIRRRVLWQFFCILPVRKNKIAVQSYYGGGYLCNPKYIVEELLKRGLDCEIYWTVREKGDLNKLPPELKQVKLDSAREIYEMCTSKIWIDNSRKWSYVKKKKSQFYIQTWHASMGLKKVEADAGDSLDTGYIIAAKKDSKMANLFLSGCRFQSNNFKEAFWYDGEILEAGIPRNDILFQKDSGLKAKVCKELGIREEEKILLYAPTFRKDFSMDCYALDYEKIRRVLSEKFGGSWHVLVRMHPNLLTRSYSVDLGSGGITDATRYHDMQELLSVSDVLITDYSSSSFDFSLVNKPCFLYVPDLEEYDRGTYFKVEDLPFPYALTNEDMAKKIYEFNEEEYLNDIKNFDKEFVGSFEKGQASATVADYIEKILRS